MCMMRGEFAHGKQSVYGPTVKGETQALCSYAKENPMIAGKDEMLPKAVFFAIGPAACLTENENTST